MTTSPVQFGWKLCLLFLGLFAFRTLVPSLHHATGNSILPTPTNALDNCSLSAAPLGP